MLNYYSREAIFSRDRSYDRDVPASRTSFSSSPYNLEVSRAAAEAAAGRPITEVEFFDANGNRVDTFFAHAPSLTNGTAPASQYIFTPEASLTFPFNHFSGQLPETERYGAFISASHKVSGEQLVAYADLFFQRADLVNELAPADTGPLGIFAIGIPPHSPGATLGGPSYEESGVQTGAYNPFNPFQQIISGGTMGRLTDFGNRRFDSRTDAFFTTAGIRGDKLFNGTWGYDTAFRYSRVEGTIDFTWPSASRFRRVLNAADPIFDPASPEYVGTTVPFNPFGDYRVPIANNQRLAAYVNAHPREFDVGTLLTGDFSIYTTCLFNLPAGGVGLAFGGQFLRETNDQNPHDELLAADLINTFGYAAVHGHRESYAVYAETSIPVFGGKFTAPGFHALDFTAAVRFEQFDNGTNVTVPKFGMRWQPFDDSFTVRATWGEGYKQPTLVELFAPTLSGAIDVFDPVKGVFARQVLITFPPNPNLQPQDSRNFTAGIVYSPKLAPGLTVTIDLFNIETTGWVDPFPNPTEVLARVAAGNPLPFESATRDSEGNLIAFSETFQNTGSQKARGADFGLAYQVQTSVGIFTSTTQATLLDSFEFSPGPGHPERELRSQPVVGFFSAFSEDAYLKWRGTSRLDWSWRGLGAAITARYFDGFHELTAFGNEHWVRQTWLFDLQASYNFRFTSSGEGPPVQTSKEEVRAPETGSGFSMWRRLVDGTIVTVGCTNLFDQDPPRANDNFPRFIYDPTGRFVYLSVTKKF